LRVTGLVTKKLGSTGKPFGEVDEWGQIASLEHGMEEEEEEGNLEGGDKEMKATWRNDWGQD
jgi:hypothetical protein